MKIIGKKGLTLAFILGTSMFGNLLFNANAYSLGDAVNLPLGAIELPSGNKYYEPIGEPKKPQSPSSMLDFSTYSDATEAQNSMDAKIDAKASYGLLTASAAAEFASENVSKGKSITYIVSSIQHETTTQDYEASDRLKSAVEKYVNGDVGFKSPWDLIKRAGTGVVIKSDTGIEIYGRVTYIFNSESSANSMKSSLNASYSSFASLDAAMSSSASAKNESYSIEVSLYQLGGKIANLNRAIATDSSNKLLGKSFIKKNKDGCVRFSYFVDNSKPINKKQQLLKDDEPEGQSTAKQIFENLINYIGSKEYKGVDGIINQWDNKDSFADMAVPSESSVAKLTDIITDAGLIPGDKIEKYNELEKAMQELSDTATQLTSPINANEISSIQEMVSNISDFQKLTDGWDRLNESMINWEKVQGDDSGHVLPGLKGFLDLLSNPTFNENGNLLSNLKNKLVLVATSIGSIDDFKNIVKQYSDKLKKDKETTAYKKASALVNTNNFSLAINNKQQYSAWNLGPDSVGTIRFLDKTPESFEVTAPCNAKITWPLASDALEEIEPEGLAGSIRADNILGSFMYSEDNDKYIPFYIVREYRTDVGPGYTTLITNAIPGKRLMGALDSKITEQSLLIGQTMFSTKMNPYTPGDVTISH